MISAPGSARRSSSIPASVMLCPLQQEPPKPLQLLEIRHSAIGNGFDLHVERSQALQSVELCQLEIFEPIPVEEISRNFGR